MKKLFLLASILLISISSIAQKTNNAVYLQIGGNGMLGSFNYERSLMKKIPLRAHVGIGIYGSREQNMTIPIGVNYLLKLGQKGNFIDVGLGCTYTKADVQLYIIVDRRGNYINDHFFNFVPSISYRKQTPHKFLFKAGITPIINQYGVIPFVGFTFGKLF